MFLKNTSKFLEVVDPFLAEIWSFVVFHRGFSILTLKIMKRQASLFQDCFFICLSILLPNFFFISWILLNILSLTAVTNRRFHENFLNVALFWCTVLCSYWLKWQLWLLFWLVRINKGLSLKKQVLNKSL